MIERYTKEKMKEIWSEENKFKKMLLVELASLKALSSLSIVPKEDYENISKKAIINISRIKEIEERTKHDVIAFTESVCENMGSEKRWFHYGLTSTDVVDTGQSLVLREANDIIQSDMESFIALLKDKALLYKNTICVGRTHGIHAEETSFGLKWLLWYDEAVRCYNRFLSERKNVEVVKLSGAVGNYNDIPFKVEEEVSKILNMPSCLIATQVISRDRHVGYINSLAMMSSLLEKIATEIRHLSRSEVGEVSEGFSQGQKGSSAMPHKKNPITSENICGLSRVVRNNLISAYDDNILWHERDISHSSVERIILPDTTILIDYMLNKSISLLSSLVVYENKMKENIMLTKGCINSSKLLLKLVDKGLTREEAYKLVQKAAFDTKNSFIETFVAENKGLLSFKEIEELSNNKINLENIDLIYRQVLRR